MTSQSEKDPKIANIFTVVPTDRSPIPAGVYAISDKGETFFLVFPGTSIGMVQDRFWRKIKFEKDQK